MLAVDRPEARQGTPPIASLRGHFAVGPREEAQPCGEHASRHVGRAAWANAIASVRVPPLRRSAVHQPRAPIPRDEPGQRAGLPQQGQAQPRTDHDALPARARVYAGEHALRQLTKPKGRSDHSAEAVQDMQPATAKSEGGMARGLGGERANGEPRASGSERAVAPMRPTVQPSASPPTWRCSCGDVWPDHHDRCETCKGLRTWTQRAAVQLSAAVCKCGRLTPAPDFACQYCGERAALTTPASRWDCPAGCGHPRGFKQWDDKWICLGCGATKPAELT